MTDKILTTLLCIDDDANLLSVIEIALATLGNYTVKLCGSGSEALELLQNFTPDMILLDMIMPNMNGLETLKKIRTVESVKNTPVILLTGRLDTQLMLPFKSLGVIDSIIKPFNPMQLSAHVQSIWNQYDE